MLNFASQTNGVWMNIWIFYELILYMNRANFPMILNKREWRHRFRSFECIQGSFEIVRHDEKKESAIEYVA